MPTSTANKTGTAAVASTTTLQLCCGPIVGDPLSADDATGLAQAFAALGDPIRLRLYSLVASADEICSCDLMPLLDRSQPTVSHHTKALADAGLITGEKRGRWVYWRAVPEARESLRQTLAG
ncbi:MAG: metalloregulator ArsR/SmtB family transcription factor [Acidimicrobiales bacterium]